MEFNPDFSANTTEVMAKFKDDDSPQQQINEQSITEALEKNRESLKRKLQSRRSIQQLVDVGIMPSPKTPVPYYEQRRKLQMRRTQDMLKNKIRSRPDRQLLIEHNILSDTIAAPAIQKTQRQLKRARLADNLNDKIAARPGVLELVASNILEIDSNLKEAIQGGRISFPSTKSSSSSVLNESQSSSNEDPLKNSTISSFPQQQQQQRPLRPKLSSSTVSINGLNGSTNRRSVNSNFKFKSSLTFHEYKGPSQKVEVTKVPLQPTRPLIVQPVQATIVPLVPLEAQSESQYRIRLQQQKLFLELQNTNNALKPLDIENSNDSSEPDQEDNPIGNLLKQPIDESVHIMPNISEQIRSFEKMKLADLKNQCRKWNLSTTGTKTKLIEKLRNATVKLSDTNTVPSSTNTNDSPLHSSTSSIQLLLSNASVIDQERYQQQHQKIVELENQLEQLKQIDSFGLHSSPPSIQIDSNSVIPQKCHPAVSAQIHKRILIQQQEKLKQKMHDEQQQQLLQQNPIVPLTPESVARFLASQSQSQIFEDQPWSMHHSTSAPSFLPFTEQSYPTSSSSPNLLETKTSDEEAIFSLLDDYTDTNSGLSFFLDHSLSDPIESCVDPATSAQTMDWVSITSPTMITDYNYDNNLDFSQFFNPIGTENHILFDQTASTCQQSSNTHSFDLFSPSSPMI